MEAPVAAGASHTPALTALLGGILASSPLLVAAIGEVAGPKEIYSWKTLRIKRFDGQCIERTVVCTEIAFQSKG